MIEQVALAMERMKSSMGQSEIIIALLFLGIVSGAVIAQNATNITNFTGDILANISEESFVPVNASSTMIVEASRTIEIYANSAIELPLTRTVYNENETLRASVGLILDNGDPLEGAELEFHLDGNNYDQL